MIIEKIIACDDGEVKKLGYGKTLVSCISYKEVWPENIKIGFVHTDGLDATSVLSYLIKTLANNEKSVVLFDSITIAGFNVISLPGIQKLTNLPSIVIYNYKPSIKNLLKALRPHFEDSYIRELALNQLKEIKKIETNRGVLYIVNRGVNKEEAIQLINSYQFYSTIPEPLRMSHIISSHLSKIINPYLP
ncbi:hypothetical protein Calag_0002 [Caldisphaera lagunensis DSM 15908]|uniref:UPF0215 protein Calag_0002 n=1 Tax=Caldisphaera lagunensis (strain DSM 15908 / JCM 11604 / ANMR 0165 / IC-154) TaxID=1056495 RepID=L0A7F3_CALLD|nr:DUF99 family protein [Caldisphaera lagunensis]AFZ69798.1 hypothetical protein Calag_0002 [Caldisphaera lagunensis DSM 15908]